MGVIILLITTLIWGTAFLAQKIGGDFLGPFALTVLRNVLGGGFLLGVIALRRRKPADIPLRRSLIAGVASGVPLFFAMLTQQVGIAHTTPGISAFLTTNYMLFIPILTAILMRRLPPAHIWVGCAMALAGTYFICLPPDVGAGEGITSIGRGEAWTILCAFLFAVQMMVVDRVAKSCDVLVMSAVQLFTGSLLGLPFLLLPSESSHLASCGWGLKPILSLVYLGVFSSGIAYTLQNLGQARTSATVAAIVFSLESVFGALSGWLILGDTLSCGQLTGCGLVFAAVVMTQILDIRKAAVSSKPPCRKGVGGEGAAETLDMPEGQS